MTHPIGDYLICRMCLVEDAEMTCIFDVEEFEQVDGGMCEAIKMCASVQITKGDGLPEHMCSQCIEDLKRAILFKNRCEKSDITLRGLLHSSLISRVKEEPNEEMDVKVEVTDSTVNFEDEYSMESNETFNEGISGRTTKPIENLSANSRAIYNKEYKIFDNWRSGNLMSIENESTMLAYFRELSIKFSPSSLWTKYSILKSTLVANDNVDISRYNRLLSFLKQQLKGYIPKTTPVLTGDQVLKFMNDAPNETYLMHKVVLVMVVFGGLKRDEMVKMTVDDVQDEGHVLLVRIPETKAGEAKGFTIAVEEEFGALQLVRQYTALRPKGISERRFFLNCKNNRCNGLPVGKNTIGSIPKIIAQYLKLENANEYTGHCLRYLSSKVQIGADATFETLKMHGKWRSTGIAEAYIAESVGLRNRAVRTIASCVGASGEGIGESS